MAVDLGQFKGISKLEDLSPEAQAQLKEIRDKRVGSLFEIGDPRNVGLRSTLSAEGVDISPGILGLRTKGAEQAGGLLTDLRASRLQTIGEGREEFVKGRTDPLRETISRQGEALTKRLGQTDVTGEFAEQTQESFQASAQQKLASGKQLALDEFTSLSSNLDQVEGGILRLMENIDFSAFTQDLQARGLSQDLKNQLTRLEQGRIGIDQQQKAADRAEAGNLISLFASLFS